MREVQASEAKTHLPKLLTAVERGETIVITRHGRAIAHLVPAAIQQQEQIRKIKDRIAAFRRDTPLLSTQDILSARHAEHRY